MQRKYNPEIIFNAKKLRKNMTKEEKHLWYDYLRKYPVKFTRQKVLGDYIADFYCAEAKLVVELDGSQHYEKENAKNDKERTAFLKGYNITVVRISNLDLNRKFESACLYIDNCVKEAVKGDSE